MTREEWEAAWRATFERLRDGGLGPIEAQRLAREMTTKRHGPQPAGPPLWLRLGMKFLAKKLAGMKPGNGEVSMQFSWVKSFLKGLQAVAEAALAIGLAAAADHLLLAVDEEHELSALGVPPLFVPVMLLLVRMGVNWIKVWRSNKAAEAFIKSPETYLRGK